MILAGDSVSMPDATFLWSAGVSSLRSFVRPNEVVEKLGELSDTPKTQKSVRNNYLNGLSAMFKPI